MKADLVQSMSFYVNIISDLHLKKKIGNIMPLLGAFVADNEDFGIICFLQNQTILLSAQKSLFSC